MNFIKKNILLISPEHWSHIFVSKHHYATHLAAKGNKVFFLNPPSDSQLKVTASSYNGLSTVDYNGFVKGLRYYPVWIQQYLIRKKFNALQAECGVVFDVIWSFDNSVFYDFNAIPDNVLKISHIVDLNQDFETAKAATSADICIGTTKYIVGRLKLFNLNTFLITHGYNANQFSCNISLPGSNKIKVIYAGNLSMPYLDWSLIQNIIEANDNIDFLFLGSGSDNFDIEINKTHNKKQLAFEALNTYIVGKVPSYELMQWYIRADILLISYQEKYFKDQSNPHKMMEYLGSGQLVVATYTEEYEHLRNEELVIMSENNIDFSNLFKKAVDKLDYYNSKKNQYKRKVYAMDNTYNRQIERIEKLVTEKI